MEEGAIDGGGTEGATVKRDLFTKSIDTAPPSSTARTIAAGGDTSTTPSPVKGYAHHGKLIRERSTDSVTSQHSVQRRQQKQQLRRQQQQQSQQQSQEEDTIEESRETGGVHYILELLCTLGAAQRMLCWYNCQEAIRIFQTLPLSQFNTGWVQHQVGRAYFEIADYPNAQLALETMQRLEPHRMKGLEILSTTLWHLKKEVELANLAQRSVDFDRMAPESWCVVGNCFSLQKEHETALTFFRRSIQLDESFAYSHTLGTRIRIERRLRPSSRLLPTRHPRERPTLHSMVRTRRYLLPSRKIRPGRIPLRQGTAYKPP